MPLATKNNALIVKDGKVAESCGCCGGQCEFGPLPQSIELDITVTSAPKLYAFITFKIRRDQQFNYYPCADAYYCDPITSGTYSLANTSGADYLFSNNALTLSAKVAPTNSDFVGGFGTDAALPGAGLFLECRLFKILANLKTESPTGSPTPATEPEMQSLLPTILASPNATQFIVGAANTDENTFYSPYVWLKYRCLGENTAQAQGVINSNATPTPTVTVTSNTLFPVAISDTFKQTTIRKNSPWSQVVQLTDNAFFLGGAFGTAYGLNGTYGGDFQRTSGVAFGSNFYSYSWTATRQITISAARAVFANGTAKALPFG